MTFLRSLLFLAWFLLVSLVLNIGFLPVLLLRGQKRAHWCRMAAIVWSRAGLWGLRVFARIDMRVLGDVPRGPLLVAAKHMSMWDTMALFMLMDHPAVVLKKELLSVPFYGWYASRAEMIAVDRKAGASALRLMAEQGRAALARNRAILIFPEGTRRKPGDPPDYKPGIAGLYGLLDAPCVPVALNSGLHWRGSFWKIPGTITIAFLPAIPPGLRRADFMARLETAIEAETARLLA